MTWRSFASWEMRRRVEDGGRAADTGRMVGSDSLCLALRGEVRRRAVVAGRVFAGGAPCSGPVKLALNSVPPGRRFDCQTRGGGVFFFLDVPAGRYTLTRSSSSGEVIQTTDIVVAPYVADTRMPVVQVDLEFVNASIASV